MLKCHIFIENDLVSELQHGKIPGYVNEIKWIYSIFISTGNTVMFLRSTGTLLITFVDLII